MRIGFIRIFIVFVIFLGTACSLNSKDADQSTAIETQVSINLTEFALTITSTSLPDNNLSDIDEDQDSTNYQSYSFEELGFSLDIPTDLVVIRNPNVNADTPEQLESYLFYIQNYGGPDGESSGDFQMYGHVQFNLPTISWETFSADHLDSPMFDFVYPIELDGLRGFETQLSGQRNNFVYFFLIDGHVLTIAVSAPTDENKELADEILSTLKEIDPQ
jgi:hypothetical protein